MKYQNTPPEHFTDRQELRLAMREATIAAKRSNDTQRYNALKARDDVLRAEWERENPEAKGERAKADAEYIAWCDRQGTTAREMDKDGLSPFTGGTEQPIFWQDGQAVEAGAARLDTYDARNEYRIFIRTARAFEEKGGYQLPADFLLEAAQMFYQDGQLCEVRLSGYNLRPQPDENGQPIFEKWQTKRAPKVTATEDGLKATDRKKRPQIAALNETAQEILTLERDYYARLKTQTEAQEPKNILRLCIAWDLHQEPSARVERALPRVLELPNNGAERDLHRALMAYPAWPLNQNTIKRHHEGREGTTTTYQPEIIDALLDSPEQALIALDERFAKMKNEVVADVVDILFHHWSLNKSGPLQRAAISLERVCEYRGVLPKGDNLELHWRAFRDARSIRLQNGGVDAALFEADTVNLFRSDLVPDRGLTHIYAPGFLVQYALEENRLYQAPFLEGVWKLNPRAHSTAKRLARYLRGEWRLNADDYLNPQSARGWLSWRAILGEAGIFPDQWDSDARHIARHIKGVEEAISTLYDLEFLAEAGKAIYHADDRPRLAQLPRKGRLEAWLELRVRLTPASDVADVLAIGAAKRFARKERQATALAEANARKKLNANKKKRGSE